MKTVQYFSKEYLEECKKIYLMEILKFLDDFRILFGKENLNYLKSQEEKFTDEFLKEFKEL